MFEFKLQLFAGDYQESDLATVGQIKTLATRVAARLVALENRKAIRSVVVDSATNTLKFYSVIASEVTDQTVPETTFTLPADLYLHQTGTTIVENFTFSAATYPGATDPNLDGKTVLVLAVKSDDANDTTVKYSFANMSGIISDLIPKVDNATAGNLPELQSDGTLADSSIKGADVFTKISNSTTGNIMVFDANGKVADSGHAIATDAQFEAMLTDAGLPSVTGGNNP